MILEEKKEIVRFGIGFSSLLFLFLFLINYFIDLNKFFYLFPVIIFMSSFVFRNFIVFINYIIYVIFIKFISKFSNFLLKSIIFYFLFTPLNILFKLLGFNKDFKLYKKKNTLLSYWKQTSNNIDFKYPF